MDNHKEIIKAVKAGDTKKTKQLLHANPDLIHAMTERGESIILLAVYYGQKEIAQLLLSKATELTIYEATAVGQIDQVKKALGHNPDHLHAFSADGWTPLHLAAFFGHDEIVEYLIQIGAKINIAAKNEMAVMPLHSALANRNIETAEILVSRGANVNAEQSTGWTPLHYAAAIGNVKIIENLLDAGANRNLRNNEGQMPLEVAKEKGHAVVVDLLKE